MCHARVCQTFCWNSSNGVLSYQKESKQRNIKHVTCSKEISQKFEIIIRKLVSFLHYWYPLECNYLTWTISQYPYLWFIYASFGNSLDMARQESHSFKPPEACQGLLIPGDPYQETKFTLQHSLNLRYKFYIEWIPSDNSNTSLLTRLILNFSDSWPDLHYTRLLDLFKLSIF